MDRHESVKNKVMMSTWLLHDPNGQWWRTHAKSWGGWSNQLL